MTATLNEQVKSIIAECIGGEWRQRALPDDLRLVGNVLDSMAVTKLITTLEERLDFLFDDEDLSADAFETVAALTELVKRKVAG